MKNTIDFIALDLGASNGRALLGAWDGQSFRLEELHRFTNGPSRVLGHLHWDVLRLWEEIKVGLAAYARRSSRLPAGIGVDTWGVDCALIDSAGRLLANPYHYRDSRTDGITDTAFRKVSRQEIFHQTGIQFLQFNTLFQLYCMVQTADPLLKYAHTLVMMPDLFHYWLTGVKTVEYSIASTTQMLDPRRRSWADGLLRSLGIPASILPPIIEPGTILGNMRPAVMAQTGLAGPVPVIAPGSHDTASAVAAIPGLDDRSVYISSGTWSLIGVEATEPVINDEALELNVTNEGGVEGTIRLLKNVTGLWLLQETRNQLRKQGRDYSWAELLEQAESARPFQSFVDPDSPQFLNPGDMPSAVCGFCRATEQPVPDSTGALVRCCLESLALKYRSVIDDLERLVQRPLDTVRVVGGGCRNRLLNQFTANACRRTVVTGPVEATALGNVMLQAVATGELGSVAEGRQAIAASVEQQWFEPRDPDAWEAAYERFRTCTERWRS